MREKIKIQFYKGVTGFLIALIVMSRLDIMVVVGNETPIIPSAKSVNYDLNGGTGITPPETKRVKGESFIVASISEIVPPDAKQFKEWNTKSDGSGTGYALGSVVTMPATSLKFYAIWKDIPDITIVTTGSKTTMPFVVEGKAIGGSKVILKITGDNYSMDIGNINIQPDGIWSYSFNDKQ